MQGSINKKVIDRKVNQIRESIEANNVKKAQKDIEQHLSKVKNPMEVLYFKLVRGFVLFCANKHEEAMAEVKAAVEEIIQKEYFDPYLIDQAEIILRQLDMYDLHMQVIEKLQEKNPIDVYAAT